MSSADLLKVAVEEARFKFVRLAVQFSSLALLYYDYAITWPREVKYFWTQKFTFTTLLFFACRYALVANIIYVLAVEDKLPGLTCDQGYKVSSSLSAVGRAAILFVWGARTYALFKQSKWVLVLFVPLGTLTIGLAIAGIPFVVCHGSQGPPIRELLGIMTVLYEVLSAILTTVQCLGKNKFGATSLHLFQKRPLSTILLEQGVLYYFAVCTLTLTALILEFAAPPGAFFQRLLNAHTIPISAMLTARFLLHLRDWEYRQSHSGFSMSVSDQAIQFKMTSASDCPVGWSSAVSVPDAGLRSAALQPRPSDPGDVV